MEYTLDQLLNSLAAAGLSGIGLASQYVKSIFDSTPQTELARLGSSEQWTKEIADAAMRTIYDDAAMEIKSFSDGTDITSGAVLEYDCVLSSRRRDRDGDILEPSGLTLDKSMPLLWQHLQLQPIGKHVKVLSQNEELLTCKFAIADTALGRDAATLTRFGALRKSHGFKPVPGQFEPLEVLKNEKGAVVLNDKGQPIVKGWHVKKANVYEGSLVSIPANADGNVLRVYEKQFDGLAAAFSRRLLETDVVKGWAKSLYERRPLSVPGIDLVVKSGGREVTWNPVAGRWQDISTKQFVATRDVKENETMATKAASVKCPHCGTANDLSGVPDGMDLTKQNCSACGKPLATEAKAVGNVTTKAGRSISAANESKLRAALDSLTAILDDAGLNDTEAEKAAKQIASGLSNDVVLGGKSISPIDGLAAKTIAGLSVKSCWDDTYGDELPGSYEAISAQLSRSAMTYLVASGAIEVGTDGYCRSIATFPTEVVMCCRVSTGGQYKSRCFRIAYTLDADGTAKFSGTPTEVEVKPVVMEKAFAGLVPALPPDESLLALARKAAAKIVTADGTGGEVAQATGIISQAYATLKQMQESGDLESLFA